MQIINDFNTSVEKALKEIYPKSNSRKGFLFKRGWAKMNGLVICGTHTPHDIDKMLSLIKRARENGRPFLGICFGYQLAAIEYARNVLGIKDATSEEFDSSGTFVVKKRPQIKVGLHDGETWWSDYYVSIPFETPPNFFVVPYHPEYQSSKSKPHPILLDFMAYVREHCETK